MKQDGYTRNANTAGIVELGLFCLWPLIFGVWYSKLGKHLARGPFPKVPTGIITDVSKTKQPHKVSRNRQLRPSSHAAQEIHT